MMSAVRNILSSCWKRIAFLLPLALLFGCTGKGDLIVFDLVAQPIPVHAVTQDTAPLRVAVWPPKTTTSKEPWSRVHIWGGKTYYTVPGGNESAAVALMMVKRFREHGWQAWLEAPVGSEKRSPNDVTISGKVDELDATATSYLGRTILTVSFRMTLTATNASDNSTVRMRLRGNATDRFFWFEPTDAQNLIRDIVQESLDKFLAQTKVENRAIRRQ